MINALKKLFKKERKGYATLHFGSENIRLGKTVLYEGDATGIRYMY